MEEDETLSTEPLIDLEAPPYAPYALSGLTFRSLLPQDRAQIQVLHESWFPVTYKTEFYDELVLNRMVNSGEHLYTCAAINTQSNANCAASGNGEDSIKSALNGDIFCSVSTAETAINEENIETIVGCVVGSFVPTSKLSEETSSLLIMDPTIHTRTFYIMTLGCVDEFRHQRLGTTLVKRIMELVKMDPECGALYLHVITFNQAAIRFYEKLGFYRVKEIEDYYRIDGDLHNCYLYAKYFNGKRFPPCSVPGHPCPHHDSQATGAPKIGTIWCPAMFHPFGNIWWTHSR